jgi:hypothetical protein
MTIRLILLTLFSFTLHWSTGQIIPTTQAFHARDQICNYVGSTNYDLVLEIFKDSTIRVSIYTSSLIDLYNSVVLQTYFGAVTSRGDTINVRYLTNKSEIKNKNQKKIFATEQVKMDKSVGYPCNTFILNDSYILAVDRLFPRLIKTDLSTIKQLADEFKNWDKKNSSSKKIFGLPD